MCTALTVYRWGPLRDRTALLTGIHAVAGGAPDRVWERLRTWSTVPLVIGPVTAVPLESLKISPLLPERARLGALIRTLRST